MTIIKGPARFVALVLLLVPTALIATWYFAPESFYRFGHYLAGLVPETALREPAFRTPGYCRACHSERHAQWSANSHKLIGCAVCHGEAQGHPQNGSFPIPYDLQKLCTLCHEATPARHHTQPLIHPAEHAAGKQCIVCHNPHAPKM